jgi:2-amino-4-hydroxy-6-hydroxymethyldihydropteridine diphosphokinase
VSTSTAYIALGANLGDREQNLRAALARLEETPGVRVAKVSAFREYPAVGGPPDSPPFLNGVAEVESALTPHALLGRLLDIERELGRERREKWGPRTIDLDLLLYGDQIIRTEHLTVPHPRLHERRFVLEPLAEIAPEAVHPIVNATITSLLTSPVLHHAPSILDKT